MGIGAVIDHPGLEAPIRVSEPRGHGTNQLADYEALVHVLRVCLKLGARCVRIHTHNEVLFKQLRGEYDLGDADVGEAKELMERFSVCRIVLIRREQNKEAQELAKRAAIGGEPLGCGPMA
jgi:ribonuclease HI